MGFHIIEGSSVIVRKQGRYRQTVVAKRDGQRQLYLKDGAAYLAMYASGGTTDPALHWEDLELPDGIKRNVGEFGRLEAVA